MQYRGLRVRCKYILSKQIQNVYNFSSFSAYYFSKENIVSDTYLQSLMDANKYVCLKDIIKFKRIVQYSGGDSFLVRAYTEYFMYKGLFT